MADDKTPKKPEIKEKPEDEQNHNGQGEQGEIKDIKDVETDKVQMVPLSDVNAMIEKAVQEAMKNQTPQPAVVGMVSLEDAAKLFSAGKVDGSGPSEGAEQVLRQEADAIRNQERISLMIPSTESKKDDVSVTVQGFTFVIQRDQWVKVPLCVLHVLNDAKVRGYVQRKREDGEGMELVEQTTQRFAVQTQVGD